MNHNRPFGYMSARATPPNPARVSGRGEMSRARLIELGTEQQIGRWTLLRPDNRPLHNGQAWLCRCACGVERRVRTDRLRAGTSMGCGCASRERDYSSRSRWRESSSFAGAAEMTLPSGHVVTVDESDMDLVSNHRWHVKKNCGNLYAVRHGPVIANAKNRGVIFMHREILNPDNALVVDHRNGHGLDNRRCNLRACTAAENVRNSRVRATSRFKGVRHGRSGSFYAFVAHKYLGSFVTPEEAALAYDQAAKQMFGEFARLNFPDIHEGDVS
jgi:hypothetical protein